VGKGAHNAPHMDYFRFSKPLLQLLPAERAHHVAVFALKHGLLPAQPVINDPLLTCRVAGLAFPNPVGLAAGFDKNAQTLGAIFAQGFGFVECGTVTPRAQPGNPRPRVFRLKQRQAIINRLGFNNDGLVPFMSHLHSYTGSGIVGANIGKNKDSEDALRDYLTCLLAVYPHVHYLTVNVSSPNTTGLRDLQRENSLKPLIEGVHAARDVLSNEGHPHKPIFIKLAPDLDVSQCEAIAQLALHHQLDGLIISNTTTARPFEVSAAMAEGGLSGPPLFALSTDMLRRMYRLTKGQIPLIGVGGISSGKQAYTKIKAGASLIQLYTGLVYQGFGLVTEINEELVRDRKSVV